MTSPNQKLVASLNRSVKKILDDQFDEFDIKLLLIDMREYLRGETFLREVADFVAHPERERGVCHKAINARYAKMKMVAAGTRQLIDSKIITRHPNQPDQFYTDRILNFVSLPEIPKADFQLFVLDSLDDLTNELLLRYYNLNKENALQLIQRSFTKDAGIYRLKSTLKQREVALLDDLLKFIRGTILGQGVISVDRLRYEFETALTRITTELGLLPVKGRQLRGRFSAVFVCILALMHDARFKLYDGTEARAYLSFHRDNDGLTNQPASRYTLTLMAATPEVSFPVITSHNPYDSFIDERNIEPADFDLRPIPWVHTRRDGNRLLLVKEAAA